MAEKKAKLLFVSKDMGAAEMGIPLAEAARNKGYDIVLVVEGLAAARYEAKGFSPFFKGTVDYRDIPFTLDAEALVKSVNPNAVIATMSSPINLEDQIGAAANALKKPLVAVNDFWGGLTRAKKAKADLMLAIDEVDVMAARNHFRQESGPGLFSFTHKFETAVVGNHAIRTLRLLAPSAEITQKMAELKQKFGTVILFAGGGADYTTPEINLLTECLKKTTGRWIVIKRYHPKHAERKAPDGRTFREVWDEKFAELGDRAIEVPTKEADAVASLANCTISGFSTLMTSAVGSYQSAIALVTPETQKSKREQMTIERYPLSIADLVPEVKTPCDLTEFLNTKPDQEKVDAFLKPYDPELALEEIEKRFLR